MIWLFVKSNWRLLLILAVVAALGGYIAMLHVQRNHAREKVLTIQTAFEKYQATVRVEGEAAKLRLLETLANSERAKNETVVDLQDRLAATARDRDRLRISLARSGGSVLPAVPPGAPAVDARACFDRTILDRALQAFVRETSELAAEGDAAAALRDGWLSWYLGQIEAAK